MTPAELQVKLDEAHVRYFTAREVLFLPKAKPPRTIDVPDEYAGNLLICVAFAEAIRRVVGHPLAVSGGYRPEWYNDAVGGSEDSAHLRAAALDLNLFRGGRTRANSELLRKTVVKMWECSPIMHGIGFYANRYRVHIDVAHDGSNGRRYWKKSRVLPYLSHGK